MTYIHSANVAGLRPHEKTWATLIPNVIKISNIAGEVLDDFVQRLRNDVALKNR